MMNGNIYGSHEKYLKITFLMVSSTNFSSSLFIMRDFKRILGHEKNIKKNRKDVLNRQKI